jgi:hypothetical protein
MLRIVNARRLPKPSEHQLWRFVSGFQVSHYAHGLESSATLTAAFNQEIMRLRVHRDLENNLSVQRLNDEHMIVVLWRGRLPDNYDNEKWRWKTVYPVAALPYSCPASPIQECQKSMNLPAQCTCVMKLHTGNFEAFSSRDFRQTSELRFEKVYT